MPRKDQDAAARAPQKNEPPDGTGPASAGPFWTRRDLALRGSAAAGAAWLGGKRAAAALAAPSEAAAPVFPLTRSGAGSAQDHFAAFLTYRPRHDPDAPFFRSFVRREPTIAPRPAAQAHPQLDPRPQLASLTGCYRTLGPAASDAYKTQRYGTPPPGGVYVTRMAGSHDMLVSWSGPGLIPNPALTDAAHRNGAVCLGCVFQPDHRMYDGSVAPAGKTAARLVELAQYFGFDGYFVNFENGTPAQHAQVLSWIARMRDEAARRGLPQFTIQFYDGSAEMAQLLPGRNGLSSAGSVMLDQGWSGYSMTHGCCSGAPTEPASVAAYCAAHGFDRFRSAYFGFQLYPGPGYLGLAAPAVITPDTAAHAYGSLQIYSWDDGLYNLEAFAVPEATPAQREQAFYRLERLFFMGQSGDPARDNAPTTGQARLYAGVAGGTRRYTDVSGEPRTADHVDDQARLPITYGVRSFITERSVVGSLPFVTRFNVGTGEAFWLDGEKVGSEPWFHLGAQDILPTWQWWQQPMIGPVPGLDVAYTALSIDYDRSAAWNGGACLHLTGAIADIGMAVRLYATDLPLQSDLCVQMVWRADSVMPQPIRCGLVFADAPETLVWVRSSLTGSAGNGWVRGTFPLSAYAGRQAVSVALGFAGAGPLDLRLGELYLGPIASGTPAVTPRGFHVEACTPTETGIRARLRWHFDPDVAFYDLFALRPGREWLGRITADCFYVENVTPGPDGALRFALSAASRQSPLCTSAPATTAPLRAAL